ncbi:MAG: hypothetical protein KKF62_02610 [Bacteroidetes bacterium]|nr:hypothetical protein [Bacteroidota bacterium]MBU1116773.1 hypothetical protein [Bacteroidota bacterium]MBU1798838.1 hypothetical protein [Bacteroidota bacterium]
MILSNNFSLKIFVAFIVSFGYAVLRYNFFGNVPLEEIPLYITNKAISLTVIFLLLFSIQKTSLKEARKKLWKLIFILTSIHVFISFRLLGPEHYQKFYFENELNIIGYLTIFFGITGFVGFLILRSDNLLPTENGKLKIPNSLKNVIRTIIPIFILGHLFSMGIYGWLSPNKWPGFMIPISLIGFILALFYLKSFFIKRK